MQWRAKFSVVIFITVLSAGFAHAQSVTPELSVADTISKYSFPEPVTGNSFTVREIEVSGNKKTKRSIILREVPFEAGEVYPLSELVKKFEQARKQLLNTALFHEVVVALKKFEGNNVDIQIAVKERWYYFLFLI